MTKKIRQKSTAICPSYNADFCPSLLLVSRSFGAIILYSSNVVRSSGKGRNAPFPPKDSTFAHLLFIPAPSDAATWTISEGERRLPKAKSLYSANDVHMDGKSQRLLFPPTSMTFAIPTHSLILNIAGAPSIPFGAALLTRGPGFRNLWPRRAGARPGLMFGDLERQRRCHTPGCCIRNGASQLRAGAGGSGAKGGSRALVSRSELQHRDCSARPRSRIEEHSSAPVKWRLTDPWSEMDVAYSLS